MNRIVMMSICISMPCAGMIPQAGTRPSRKSVTFAAPSDEERGAASSGALAGYGSLDVKHSVESPQFSEVHEEAHNSVGLPQKLRKDHPLQKYWPDSSSDDGEFTSRSCRCSTSAKVCAAFCSTFGLCAGFLAYVMLSEHGEKPR